MMQQIYQQDPNSTQDPTGQQMVLCPVRVVYETQMLVQSGDQMQPNQTILINPQNPPPWIQNRPVQNQVLYVQHMPTNYMQPPQQHIDPNQLYLQNFAYQNIQPMFVQSPQDQIRPMQMVPPNVVHNIQGNTNPNLQNQRILTNTPTLPQTINAVPNQNIHTQRPVVPNQIAHINELVNNIRPQDNINIGPNTYRQPAPQIMQQEQKIQVQPTITMVPNNIQSMQRFPSPYDQSNQVRPIAQQNIANIQPTHQNTIQNVQEIRKTPTTANKGIQHMPTVPVKGPQAFRPIQPRTNQIRASGPNIISVQPSNTVPQNAPNTITINNGPRKIIPNNVPITNSISISSNGKIEGNSIPLNRKRKSESPDDLHRKISNNPSENPIIIKRIENVSNVNCTDVGVNTSPIHKPDGRIIINNMQITPLRQSHDPNTKIKEELAKPIRNMPILETQNIVRSAGVATPNSLPMLPTEKDKLVRNTVFTQARGRVLTDKGVSTEVRNINGIDNKQPIQSASTVKEQNLECKSETKQLKEAKEIKETKLIKETTEIKEIKETKDIKETKQKETERDVKNSKLENFDSKILKEENKPSITLTNTKTPDIKLKDDRNFVLTHVLDGYVIQESNVAFPIRKPLKEKTLQINISEPGIKKEVKEEKETDIRNNSKILDISHLQIKEIENMDATDDKDKVFDKENPFVNLKVDTVKTWTTEQLTTHLNKFAWSETISVLLEHEIDGESLFLVSKGQLVTIGVSEEHADVICQFVKS